MSNNPSKPFSSGTEYGDNKHKKAVIWALMSWED